MYSRAGFDFFNGITQLLQNETIWKESLHSIKKKIIAQLNSAIVGYDWIQLISQIMVNPFLTPSCAANVYHCGRMISQGQAWSAHWSWAIYMDDGSCHFWCLPAFCAKKRGCQGTVCARIVGYLTRSSPQVNLSDSTPLSKTDEVHPLNLKKMDYDFTAIPTGFVCSTDSFTEYSEWQSHHTRTQTDDWRLSFDLHTSVYVVV